MYLKKGEETREEKKEGKKGGNNISSHRSQILDFEEDDKIISMQETVKC